MAQLRIPFANRLADRERPREYLLGSRTANVAFAAAAGILLLAGLALWQQHGLLIYVDMLATGIWNCF